MNGEGVDQHAGRPDPSVLSQRTKPDAAATVVGICASTGGPQALEIIVAELPADFRLPVLVVQHMAGGFMAGLIRRLAEHTPLPVGIVRGGQPAVPGIWFPPEDAHLVLDPSMRLELDDKTVVGQHRPSADMLLESMASSAGPGAVGVMLTGGGHDGARGVDAVRRRGGFVIAQDQESSAVFGMPKAAAEAGADLILPLARIAGALSELPIAGVNP